MNQQRNRRHSAPSGETGLSIPLHDLGLKLWQWLVARDAEGPLRPCAISLLPVELLQAIFTHCLDVIIYDVSLQRDKCVKVAKVPVILGGVCTYWRQVTLATPALWNHLWFEAPGRQEDPQFLQLWMQRLGSHHPLHLRLEEPDLPYFETALDANFLGLLRATIAHASQWKQLDLYISWKSMASYLHLVPLANLPMLESLSMRSTPLWTLSRLYKSLSLAPKLTALRFTGHEAQLKGIEWVDGPWEQIITADFESGINWSTLASILARSRSLRHLSINMVFFEGIIQVEEGSIVIPKLTSLTLGPHLLFPAQFFDSLTLPALLDLKLNRTFGYQFHEGYTAVSRMVARSRCRLRSFAWFEPSGNVGLPPEDFVLHALLSPKPMFLDHVVTLKIASPVRDVHLKALSHRRALQRLENISLEQCWSSDGALSEMILSRATALKSVSAVLYGSGIIVNPKFKRDLSLDILGVRLDIRKG